MDDEISALYGAPPEEFVSRRNALAKTLREAGERDAAARVKALQKPTVPAWALNQLARRHPDLVGQLIGAADRMQLAQRRALGGGASGDDLREAMASYRQAVDDLTREAGRILAEAAGNPSSHLAEVTASLQAAGVDEEARRHLREGTLTRPFPAPGLGALSPGLSAVPDEAPAPESGEEAVSEETVAARQALERARRRQREAEERLGELARRADELRRRAAERQEHADRLAAEAARADQEARRARQEADEAATSVGKARTDLAAADRSVEEAGQRLSAAGGGGPDGPSRHRERREGPSD